MWGGVTGVLKGASSFTAAACCLICLVSACFAAADFVAACTGFFSALFVSTSCVAVSAPSCFAAALPSSVLFKNVAGTMYAPNLLLA